MRAVALSLAALLPLAAQAERTNPITRVAELLQGLAKKVDADHKAEEELYGKFKCWCKGVESAKSASIASATSRIEELETYIDDLKNGRVELTDERVQLEKQQKELNTAIQEATELRNKEHEDFTAAEAEMKEAIEALTNAVEALREGTAQGGEAMLASVETNLRRAVQMGRELMSASDAQMLEKLLEDPKPDWKKLNREATFKKKYTARSGKIQQVLGDMLQTFEDNLKDAQDKEEKAVSTFEKLMGGKREELAAVEQAIEDMAKEKGARGMALADAEQELDDSRTSRTNDEKFLQDTKATCEEKAGEWAERKALRMDEIKSINEAIAILRSDDARDTFKRSFASQSFVQVAVDIRAESVSDVLRRAAAEAGSVRLAALALTASTGGHFDKVISKIDEMIADLDKEGSADLEKKEQCEKDRMENTQEAKMVSKEIDTNTANIAHFETEVAEKKEQIKEAEKEIAQTEEELQAAADQRDKEHAEYQLSKADDENAVELVQRAVGVLRDFYSRNQLSLAQEAPAAGEAPPPPPSTWDAGYGGAKGEHDGIVSILEMIGADIQKDLEKSTANEKEAQTRFDTFKADSEATIESLRTKITDLDGEVGAFEEKIGHEKEQRKASHGALEETLAFLKKVAPGCDFVAVHFDVRSKNRALEADGLRKAKAILSGAAFPTQPDPTREIKPGDAFLQRH